MQQVLGAIATAVATSLLGLGQASYYAAGGNLRQRPSRPDRMGLCVHVCFGCVWFARGVHAEATCGKKTDVVPEMELHEMKACAPAQPAGER